MMIMTFNHFCANKLKLKAEVSVLSPRVAFLDHQRLLLNVDNSALKQRIAALSQDKIFKDGNLLLSLYFFTLWLHLLISLNIIINHTLNIRKNSWPQQKTTLCILVIKINKKNYSCFSAYITFGLNSHVNLSRKLWNMCVYELFHFLVHAFNYISLTIY